MNGKSYSGRYRPSSYRRKRIPPVLIFILFIVVLLVAAFLIIGNLLNDKTEEAGKPASTSDGDLPQSKPTPTSVICQVLDIEGEASSQTNNNLAALAQRGAAAVSVKVNGSDSKILYDSDVAKAFGFQSGGFIEMSTIVSRAQSRGIYVSAYFKLGFMSEKNNDVRAAKLGYEAALVGEMCAAGVGDVMIYAPDATSENYVELVRLANNVKAVMPNAKIGIALKSDIFSSQNAAVVIDALFEVYDIIGIDLSDAKAEDAEEYLDGALGKNLYYVLRYNARVIVPSFEDKETASAIEAVLASNSVTNIQYVKTN